MLSSIAWRGHLRLEHIESCAAVMNAGDCCKLQQSLFIYTDVETVKWEE